MTLEDAVTLIITEARSSGDSLLTSVRNGEDPGTERMRRLISALDTIYNSLSGHVELNRGLAAALFSLGSDVPLTISALASKGHAWRRGFMEVEVYELLVGVQSIFEDRRFEPEQAETVN
jgi:hypothetical protein